MLSECANLLSTSKTNESFDAGNPVGGIEPLNISYCIKKYVSNIYSRMIFNSFILFFALTFPSSAAFK